MHRRHPFLTVVLLPTLLITLLHFYSADGGATAEAEQNLYDAYTAPPPKYPDYHALLDWYYTEVAAGRQPDSQTLKDEIRRTMKYRLAQPQVYYEGTGYIPGVDEGWRPDVDSGTYKSYREEKDEAIRKMSLKEKEEAAKNEQNGEG